MTKIYLIDIASACYEKGSLDTERKALLTGLGIEEFSDVDFRLADQIQNFMDACDDIDKAFPDMRLAFLVLGTLADGNHLPVIFQGLSLFIQNVSHR